MPFDDLTSWAVTALLLSLRVAPAFTLAPPFTLTRTPAPFRMFFGLGLAGLLAAGLGPAARLQVFDAGGLLAAGARELFLGSIFVLALRAAFAGLQVVGRTIDIQAGFGLAMVLDPQAQSQSPLTGTLLAYAAGVVFFAADGHLALLRLLSASVEAIPVGAAHAPTSLGPLTRFLSAVFMTSFGVAGAAILSLFLADVAIALMSRTLPQMNVLVLGLQVKTLLMLVLLPVLVGGSGALLARLIALTFDALPGLM